MSILRQVAGMAALLDLPGGVGLVPMPGGRSESFSASSAWQRLAEAAPLCEEEDGRVPPFVPQMARPRRSLHRRIGTEPALSASRPHTRHPAESTSARIAIQRPPCPPPFGTIGCTHPNQEFSGIPRRDRPLSRAGEGGFAWRGTSLAKPGEGLALSDKPPDPHPSPLGSFLAKRRSPLPQGERGRLRPDLRPNFQGAMCESDSPFRGRDATDGRSFVRLRCLVFQTARSTCDRPPSFTGRDAVGRPGFICLGQRCRQRLFDRRLPCFPGQGPGGAGSHALRAAQFALSASGARRA